MCFSSFCFVNSLAVDQGSVARIWYGIIFQGYFSFFCLISFFFKFGVIVWRLLDPTILSQPGCRCPRSLFPPQGQLCCALPLTFCVPFTDPESLSEGQMLERELDKTAKRDVKVWALWSPLAFGLDPRVLLSLAGRRITEVERLTGLCLLLRKVLFPMCPGPSSFLQQPAVRCLNAA